MSGTTSGVEFSQSGDDTNMRIFGGKTLNFNIVWGAATPIDVTGFDAVLQARDNSDVLMLDLTVANGGVTIGTTDGLISFTASPTLTNAVNANGNYEVELTNGSGDIFRAISGSITPIAEIVQ